MAKNADRNHDESFTDFSETVAGIGGGMLNEKLSERLNEVTRKARETGKGGSVTLTLKVKPAGQIGTMVQIDGKVTAKVPEPDLPGAIMYAKDDGTLHVDDPRQLKLRTVAPIVAAIPIKATSDAKSEKGEE